MTTDQLLAELEVKLAARRERKMMTELKELIEREIDQYLEWPTADKSQVTTVSAKLFAEHVARLYADHIPADEIPARTTFGGPQRFTTAEQQPVPNVAALVEALEWIAGADCDPGEGATDFAVAMGRGIAISNIHRKAAEALAAHRKGGAK